jgi:hypothetical protein
MNIGMMWFDNDPKKTLAAKILEAAGHYRAKYGQIPDTVIVNPVMLVGQQYDPQHVKALRWILPGHLWIGVEAQ